MIDLREVFDAVLVVLRATEQPVGDAAPPDGDLNLYAVLEGGPGTSKVGTVSAPERGAVVRVRVRVVARSANKAAARQSAQHLARVMATALLDRTTPIAGEGWSVSGRRHIADSGPIPDGELVNQVDDYELDVWA